MKNNIPRSDHQAYKKCESYIKNNFQVSLPIIRGNERLLHQHITSLHVALGTPCPSVYRGPYSSAPCNVNTPGFSECISFSYKRLKKQSSELYKNDALLVVKRRGAPPWGGGAEGLGQEFAFYFFSRAMFEQAKSAFVQLPGPGGALDGARHQSPLGYKVIRQLPPATNGCWRKVEGLMGV